MNLKVTSIIVHFSISLVMDLNLIKTTHCSLHVLHIETIQSTHLRAICNNNFIIQMISVMWQHSRQSNWWLMRFSDCQHYEDMPVSHLSPQIHFNIHKNLQNITCNLINKFTMLDKHVTSLPYSKGKSCRHHMLYTIINKW
jgi:hypothetical protein